MTFARCLRYFAVLILLVFATQGLRAQVKAPHLEEAKSRTAAAPRVAPASMLLFGAIPVSTHSREARKFVELALDKYEGVMVADAVVLAKHATEKDPDFALGYAVLSFASRKAIPNSAALARAKALLPHATPDERLLVRWMTSVQERDLLPAIASMNDLLKRYPNDKHVLYLTSTWLYSQQDYERSQKMMEALLIQDPNFSPVLNMLGYAYMEVGHPDPSKAVATLKRYAELEPSSPNPEDSMGEVLRYIGDDDASLEHYGAALQIEPTFFSSQLGLGDTLTLKGAYEGARLEYDKAMRVASNQRDFLHASHQKALIYFWEGRPDEGKNALAEIARKAAGKEEPNELFEARLSSAMLSANYSSELQQLLALEQALQNNDNGMTGADRGSALAIVLCEEARIASLHEQRDVVESAISRLARSAAQSGDLRVTNNYDKARGFLLLSQNDLFGAADALTADKRSPLAVQQLAIAQEKLGDKAAAEETRAQLRYQRAPTVEWFLASHAGGIAH